MSNHRKTIPARSNPENPKKYPIANSPKPVSNSFLFLWSFKKMDWDGPFSWGKLNFCDFQRVINKLSDFETFTNWNALTSSKSHLLNNLDGLSKKAKNRLGELDFDGDRIFSFRLMGKERVICSMEEFDSIKVMYLLWWDPNHEVWPVNVTDN